MGAWGAMIMSFFGAFFCCIDAGIQLHWKGARLGLPFLVFAAILLAASVVIRLPGKGISPSKRGERAILWSTLGEGLGLFIAANVSFNVHHPEMLLPAMALVVGLHFLPIAYAEAFAMDPPLGGLIAGFAAAGALWLASLLAIVRDSQAKRTVR